MARYTHFRFFVGILSILIAYAAPLLAQGSNVDPSFNAVPTAALATDTNIGYLVQPDGKVLVYNAPAIIVNGAMVSGIFRLNADGTTDSTFSYCGCADIGVVSAMVAPDGKIVLAGTTSPNHAKMIRINSDGSLDNAFSIFFASSGSPGLTGAWFTLNTIQPDGKVIATRVHWGNIQGTWYAYEMTRYNLDGSVDSSFIAPALDGGHLVSTWALIDLLPDGRFYLGISSGSHLGRSIRLTRRNANGTVDATFTEFTRSSTLFVDIRDLAITPDGGVLATGGFAPSMPGGPYPRQLFRFLPNGTPDPGFNPAGSVFGDGIHLLPDGKILHSASLATSAPVRMMRLNSDGTVDNTYVMDPVATGIRGQWQADGMNRPVVFVSTSAGPRLVRLLENGAIDPNFNPQFAAASTTTLSVAQPDGKVIVVGPFTGMNGVARNRIARLNADGSLDTGFDPGTGFAFGSVNEILVQPDGKILAFGSFNTYNDVVTTGIVRINADGSRDTTFSATASSINAAALQSDGKILIGGSFTAVNGTSRTGLARLTSTGALDTDFAVTISDTSSFYVADILVQAGGKIMIGGQFSSVNGTSRNNIVRLESTGVVDQTFDAPTSGRALLIVRQPDGKYVINDYNAQRLIRRNADGSVDTSFTTSIPKDSNDSNGNILTILPMPDGTFLMGGTFAKISGIPRNNLARLRPNGMLDNTFSVGANSTVMSIAPYSTGKVLIAGTFLAAGNLTRFGIARLNVAPLVFAAPFDFDGDGRADISVFRSSISRWYEALSSGPIVEEPFGTDGDILAPADFDGDGMTDEAIFRPSNGHWWYKSSVNGNQVLNPFGGFGDVPRPSDFDGDGKADLVLFRPSTNTWFRFGSLTNQEAPPTVFGVAGDKPLVGDFDGDGKSDLAIFRPSNGDWWYAASSAGGAFRTTHWGQTGDIPVPADYDGDGRTDYAVYRPSDGGWYIYNSGSGSATTVAFGISTDRPVAADYDGDGRADIAVFRPSTGIWYLLRSTAGFAGYQFGISTDTAVPGSMIP